MGGFRRKLLYCGRRLASDPSRPARPRLSPVPIGHSERPAGASTIREYEIDADYWAIAPANGGWRVELAFTDGERD
jgi:hypothetical protein